MNWTNLLEAISDTLLMTVISTIVGHDIAVELVNEAKENNKSVKELVIEKGILTKNETDTIFNLMSMANAGRLSEELKKMKK